MIAVCTKEFYKVQIPTCCDVSKVTICIFITYCKILAVKSCNKQIWARKDQSRSNDLLLQKIQSSMVKSNVNLLHIAESLMQAGDSTTPGVSATVDTKGFAGCG